MMRQKMLLLAAVFFGVLAFILAYQQLNYEKRRIRGEAGEYYVIQLTRDISGTEELKDGDFTRFKVKRLKQNRKMSREIPWDKNKLLIGRQLESAKDKGDILHWTDLKPAARRRTGLSSQVPNGWRAVSISSDSISSVSNLVQPEDHIDIIGTFRFPNMQGEKGFDTVTLTILQNVVVLATGSDWGRYSSVGTSMRRRGYSSVTLALTPKEAEMIIFASSKGKLTLTLRNFEETQIAHDLQTVNFRFLEKNIPVYNQEREKRQRNGQ